MVVVVVVVCATNQELLVHSGEPHEARASKRAGDAVAHGAGLGVGSEGLVVLRG